MNDTKLRLNDRLGKDNSVDPVDTVKTKQALKKLNYYEEPAYGITKYPDAPLFEAIGKFQKDNNLQFDKIMYPGGETEGQINNALSRAKNSISLNVRPNQKLRSAELTLNENAPLSESFTNQQGEAEQKLILKGLAKEYERKMEELESIHNKYKYPYPPGFFEKMLRLTDEVNRLHDQIIKMGGGRKLQ